MLLKRILRGLSAAISAQTAAAVGSTVVMLGIGIVGRAYGTEACLIALAIVIVLSLLILRACPLPMAPMCDRPEPLALSGDGLPPLPSPGARTQIAATNPRPAITRQPSNICPAVSDRAGNAVHRLPAEHR
jgi:hypothetical protein